MGSSHDYREEYLEEKAKIQDKPVDRLTKSLQERRLEAAEEAMTTNKEQWEKDLEKNDGEWPTEERIDAIGQNGGEGLHYNKYKVRLRNNIAIDVYDILDAFKVDNPATGHAIKKLLMAGKRGYKDFNQDLDEAIASIQRAKDFPSIPF